jgi:diacylglycerol kinase (ATP)
MLALLVKPTLWESRRAKAVLEVLQTSGAAVLQGSNRAELSVELAALHSNHPELTLVACGGDGTVHLALNSMPDDVSLAVIPMGTGNDFSRYLGIKDVKSALDVLSTGEATALDYGLVTLANGVQRKFLGVASCGFDAQVNERANTYRGPSGTLKYLAALFVELSKLRPINFTVVTDDDKIRSELLTLVAVGNTSSYGGGMKICPTANVSDGRFEVTYVQAVTRRLLVSVLPKVFWGGHVSHPKVQQEAASIVELGGDIFAVYADGERIGHGPVVITMQPGAVRVWQAQPTPTP